MTADQTVDGIRPYGPGKFNTILDSYVWEVSLNGSCDDETGSVDGGRWYGLMKNGRTIFKDHDPFMETLNSAERDQLTDSAGVIVSEDSYGFVHVEYFEAEGELMAAWLACLQETSADQDSE